MTQAAESVVTYINIKRDAWVTTIVMSPEAYFRTCCTMADVDALNRRTLPRITIGFLLWVLCVAAISFSAYNRWIAKAYNQRARDAEIVAEDHGIKIIRAYVSYYGVQPPRFDVGGHVDLLYCRPYVDLSNPTFQTDDIDHLLPYLQDLLPDEGKMRVAVFLSSELFADSVFVSRLRDALPNCEVFDRANRPL